MLRKLGKGGNVLGSGSGSRPVPLSVIGPDVRIVGDILTQGEMQIDGQVEGDITCKTLVVGEGARITGEVTADSVRIHGALTGKVNANQVMIAKSAQVVGDITHETLEIEAGGHLEGHLTHKGTAAPLKLIEQASAPMEEAPQAEAAQ
ncbi:MAG: polymer-forming cytoskeletal protein [Magnetospirillum sp.]|nr:polymer-forming cytoskeletal protein [Magnetospirillum sp.]